jgi:hypothetical protein
VVCLKQVLDFQRAGGRIEGPLISRGGRAFDAKIRAGEEGRYELSIGGVRSKNF